MDVRLWVAFHLQSTPIDDRPGGAVTSAIAVDATCNAYIAGYTNSTDFPTLPSSPGPKPANAQIPFVTKLDAKGGIVYSNLFSGGARGVPQAIAVDRNGNVIVSGRRVP